MYALERDTGDGEAGAICGTGNREPILRSSRDQPLTNLAIQHPARCIKQAPLSFAKSTRDQIIQGKHEGNRQMTLVDHNYIKYY